MEPPSYRANIKNTFTSSVPALGAEYSFFHFCNICIFIFYVQFLKSVIIYLHPIALPSIYIIHSRNVTHPTLVLTLLPLFYICISLFIINLVFCCFLVRQFKCASFPYLPFSTSENSTFSLPLDSVRLYQRCPDG